MDELLPKPKPLKFAIDHAYDSFLPAWFKIPNFNMKPGTFASFIKEGEKIKFEYLSANMLGGRQSIEIPDDQLDSILSIVGTDRNLKGHLTNVSSKKRK